LGTLIRHAFYAMTAAVSLLPVAMVQTPFRAALVTAVGCAMLATPRLIPARRTAVALAAIATGADREQRQTVRIAATS
jgi:hypothetical protein